jgi:hypothetical protein
MGNRTSLGVLRRGRVGQTTVAGESVFGHRLSSTGFTPPANRLCLVLVQEATEMRSVDLPPLGGSDAGRRRLIPIGQMEVPGARRLAWASRSARRIAF